MLSKLGTLVGLISLGRSFTDTPLYKRFLSGVAVVMTLTIVTGMLAGALLIGAFYGVYLAFVNYGLADTPALIATLGLATLTLVVMVMITVNYLRNLVDLPRLLMQYEFPLSSKVGGIAQSFLAGLTGDVSPHQARR